MTANVAAGKPHEDVRVTELRVGGKIVSPAARYKIAIDEYIAMGADGRSRA